MAYIVEFAIKGLAGRSEPFSAVLNRDVNVFFGLNGSGKTTLLKILHSALAADTSILRGLPFTHAEVTIFLNRYKSKFRRSYSQEKQLTLGNAVSGITQIHSRSDEATSAPAIRGSRQMRTPSWSSDPPEPDGPQLTHHRKGFLPISRLYRNLSTTAGTRGLSEQELDSAFARELQRQWTEYYADISRDVTRAQEAGLANILGFFLSGQVNKTETEDMPDADEAYRRITGFLDRQAAFRRFQPRREEFSDIYATRPELRTVVREIEAVENQITAINAPRQRFQAVLESMFTGRKHLVFSEKEINVQLPNQEQIGVSVLSSGEKQLLFIAFQALIGHDHSLIIDEPELSMHVDWQKKLVSTLRDLNPNIQQIMATHSPEIMAELSDDKIFRL